MWLDGLDNRDSLLKLYGFAPSVADVYLLEVILHQDGPKLALRFDLKQYPESPPADWRERLCNTVQVTLALGTLRSVSIEGFAKANHVRIDLQRRDRRFLLLVDGTTTIRAEADIALIQRVSAYLRKPPLQPVAAD